MSDVEDMDIQPDTIIEEDPPFKATLDSSKQFIQLLRSLTFRDRATFFISHNGLKVMVQDSKSMQLSAYFQAAFFNKFKLRVDKEPQSQGEGSDEEDRDGEIFSFNVGINNVINCLELFGDTTRVNLSYNGYGTPLSIHVDDEDVKMKCQINTFDTEDCADFNFAKSTVLAKVIINAEQFKDVVSAFQGLHDDVTIKINKDAINFCISSIFGDMDNEIPSDSLMVESYVCSAPVSAKYTSNMLKQGLKPISFSQKLSIRIDSRDLLCIQHMIEMEEQGHAFTEIYIVPTVIEEEE